MNFIVSIVNFFWNTICTIISVILLSLLLVWAWPFFVSLFDILVDLLIIVFIAWVVISLIAGIIVYFDNKKYRRR